MKDKNNKNILNKNKKKEKHLKIESIVPMCSFASIPQNHKIAQKYKLKKIKPEDIMLTYQLSDDRIKYEVKIDYSRYPRLSLTARIPTKTMGTFTIAYEYFNETASHMHMAQYLPSYLTKKDINMVVYYDFKIPTKIFLKYFNELAKERIRSIENGNISDYNHKSEKLILKLYNKTIKTEQEKFERNSWLFADIAYSRVIDPSVT